MKISRDYLDTAALFEDAVTRTSQLAAFAIIIQDSLKAEHIDRKALQDTVWLLADLLKNQHEAIVKLQELHIKDYFSREIE